MEVAEIVEGLARARIVERIIANVSGFRPPLPPDLQDLTQMVYEVILTYDSEKIKEMNERGMLQFFVARVVVNQFRSSRSPYHLIYRRYSLIFKSNEGGEVQEDEDGIPES